MKLMSVTAHLISSGPVRRRLEGKAAKGRIDALLKKMSLEDQIGQLVQYGWAGDDFISASCKGMGGSMLNCVGAEETNRIQAQVVEKSPHGIPLIFAMDVIHGFRTIFPVPLAEACSWDPDLARRTARAAAIEARAHGIRWTFAPMVDIARDPRWGRIVEGAGEDPVLGSVLAEARVRGFREGGLAACVKHLAGYGAAMGGRDYNAVDLPLRRLFDTYFPPFHAGIAAGAETLMSAFHTLNDEPASGSRFLLTELLRDLWGFEGMVVSDWGSVAELIPHGTAGGREDSAAQGFWAGVDMEMMGFGYRDHLAGLVRKGLVKRPQVRKAARRVLALKEKLGLFDGWQSDPSEAKRVTLTAESRKLAKEAALKSCVLLKNSGVLPLNAAGIGTVAVIGPLGDDCDSPLGPWAAMGKAEDVVSVSQALLRRLGQDAVITAKGCEIEGGGAEGIPSALEAAQSADAVLLVLGESRAMSGEARSRTQLGLPGRQRELAEAVLALGKPSAVVLMSGRPLALPWLQEQAPAILQAWFLGVESGEAIADLILGEASPEGRLCVSVPYHEGQIPVFHSRLQTGRPVDQGDGYSTRYLDAPNEPLYPFGFGLTYTSFEYSGLSVPKKAKAGSRINIEVTVKNTGSRRGVELAQLYLRDEVASVARPVAELKAFLKVSLGPGESRRLSFGLRPEQLGFYGRDMRFGFEPGEFTVRVGPNAQAGPEKTFELAGSRKFYELRPAPPQGAKKILVPGSGTRKRELMPAMTSAQQAKLATGPTGPTGPV